MTIKEAIRVVKGMKSGVYLESEKDEAIRMILGTMGGFVSLSKPDLYNVCDYLLSENDRLKEGLKNETEMA